jgi:hypothetical protein
VLIVVASESVFVILLGSYSSSPGSVSVSSSGSCVAEPVCSYIYLPESSRVGIYIGTHVMVAMERDVY